MTTAAEFDKRYDIINGAAPRHVLMTGRYKQSFAYYTLRERLPVILTNIIDNLTKNKDDLAAKYGEQSREEVKNVVGMISKLKYQLQTDKALEEFVGDDTDKEIWNKFIRELPVAKKTFFKTCWLYAECYMYRKVASFFQETELLCNYDYFAQQKRQALEGNISVMEAVAYRIRRLDKSSEIFIELLKLNLWGNRCDLSFSTGKEVSLTDQLALVKTLDPNLIIDETAAIWHCVSNPDPVEVITIDFVLDNSGYELFTDLVLAAYMIENNLAHKVRFHVKAIPWFISDVTLKDFAWTIDFLSNHSLTVLKDLGRKWKHYLAEGHFVLMPTEYFWTSPYEFYKMKEVAPELYQNLKKSHLIIFKGDLNYRKLLGDFTWDHNEEFITCLRGFQPTNLCTLRTVKADLICGLNTPLMENLHRKDPNWMTTGEYGVIQFSEKSQCDCS